MNVLVINPIIYTAETKEIPQMKSIKDCMIYDLCLAFFEQGHNVVLYAAENYKPISKEEYPFEVIWDKCSLQRVFMPHRFPKLKGLSKYIKENKQSIDLIISSEVFSISSLCAYRKAPEKLIIWHELALHNRMLKKIPSKVWYNVIAKLCMKNARIVPRSKEAYDFITQYCKNADEMTIDHGVNLNKFTVDSEKENSFVVCSQLIPRKRIDGIVDIFEKYINTYDKNAMLYIIGDGEERQKLEQKVKSAKLEDSVVFTGKLNHGEMKKYLSKAKALLINTAQDNSMISIVEAIAVGTPILTTDVPLNSAYIIKEKLGIAKPVWDENDLAEISQNNNEYAKNCLSYREKLSTVARVKQFEIALKRKNGFEKS